MTDLYKDPRCMWDRLAGPRPGRGECRMVMVDLVVQEVVRDDR